MRTIFIIIQKEFIQIFRDKTMLPLIIIMPFVQLVVLVYAATFEMKEIKMVVLDQDLSSFSRQLTAQFEGSPFFKLEPGTFSAKAADDLLIENKVDVVLNIPSGFEKRLMHGEQGDLQLLINAINATVAGLSQAYCQSVIVDYNKELIQDNISYVHMSPLKSVDIQSAYWYNPQLNYKIYMLPGILVVLITLIGAFLAALNIVREKEMGTIEQINVTPIQKYQFIIGKLVPFLVIALFELGLGLTIGKILFNIPILGSIPLLFGFASVYLLLALGLGLFVSTIANTQQQVMFVIFFFLLTFIMMSGIFTPVESMPQWAQKINIINPFAYFIRVIRMVLLKGSGFSDIRYEFFSVLIFGLAMLGLATWRYRKTS